MQKCLREKVSSCAKVTPPVKLMPCKSLFVQKCLGVYFIFQKNLSLCAFCTPTQDG